MEGLFRPLQEPEEALLLALCSSPVFRKGASAGERAMLFQSSIMWLGLIRLIGSWFMGCLEEFMPGETEAGIRSSLPEGRVPRGLGQSERERQEERMLVKKH